MKTYVINYFEVVAADGDGRGESHVAYFNCENAAKQLVAQSPGWMRYTEGSKTFNICETFGEYVILKNEETKARALAKLTAEERAALGF